MITLRTHDGGTVELTRSGALVDIHVRDASGRSVATVTRRAGEGRDALGDCLARPAYASLNWSAPLAR